MTNLKRFILLFLFILSGFAIRANAQKELTTAKKQIKELVDEGYIKGASLAYIQPDGDVQYFSYGHPARMEFQFNKKTLYEIGSISKTFTALILARMDEEGLVSLDTPIGIILPDSVTPPMYEGKKITLLDLATHTSGLPRLPTNMNPADQLNPYAGYTVQQMYEFLDNYELSRAPGSQFVYSNFGVGLLGHLLAVKSGMVYKQLLRHYITKPLGMNDTWIHVPEDEQKRFAKPYNFGLKAKHWNWLTLKGAGAIRSSAKDLVTYLKAQMGLIKPSFEPAIAMTHQIQFGRNDSTKPDIGLAWIYNTTHDTLIFHNGATGGFRSFVGWNLETGTGVVVLSSGTRSIDKIGLHLLDNRFHLGTIKEAIELKPGLLKKYTGTYAITPAFSIHIFMKNNHLMAQATGQKAFRIYPESQTRFFYKVVKADIEFIENDAGVITELKLYQGGKVLTGLKNKE